MNHIAKKIIQLSIVIFFFFAPSAIAGNIYVDNSLSDDCTESNYSIANRNCSGSDGNAFNTVTEGVNSMAAGDNLLIRGGTYYENRIDLGKLTSGTEASPYTFKSYPGEWAIIDGSQYTGSDRQQSIFYTSYNPARYFIFENMEIRNAGDPTNPPDFAAGILLYAAYKCEFRGLYIHDCNGSTVNPGCAGGLMLKNDGSVTARYNTIEFNHFKCNGGVNDPNSHNTGNANIALYADYNKNNTIRPENSLHKNIIRYNLIDGSCDTEGHYTDVGIQHKGMQRLTGLWHGENGNASDDAPNDDSLRDYGDDYHHNIIINHNLGMRIWQDYAQIHHNIIWNDNNGVGVDTSRSGVVLFRYHASSYRGPIRVCMYNNTANADEGQGFMIHPVHDGQTGNLPDYFDHIYVYNNFLDNFHNGYDWSGISIEHDAGDKAAYDMSKVHVHRNVFYRAINNSNLFKINSETYTESGIIDTESADMVWHVSSSPYVGSTDTNRFKLNGNYQLSTDRTISNAGFGTSHPYLKGVTIPSYIGSVNPADNAWVDAVMGLASTSNLRDLTVTPTWIEGNYSVYITNPKNLRIVQNPS